MPTGQVSDTNDEAVSLDATRSGRPAVVVFYAGGWCPYCNATLQIYERDLIPIVRSRGVAFFAISPDAPDGSLTLHELPYDVFSDQGNTISQQLGILPPSSSQADPGLEPTTQGQLLPLPTTVIVDAAGVIRWMDVRPDHTSATAVAEIVAALDHIAPPRTAKGPSESSRHSRVSQC